MMYIGASDFIFCMVIGAFASIVCYVAKLSSAARVIIGLFTFFTLLPVVSIWEIPAFAGTLPIITILIPYPEEFAIKLEKKK